MLAMLAVAAGLLAAAPAAAQEKAELARKAREVLRAHCARCHGEGGSVEGGVNYVLDLRALVERKKVVAGRPDESPLFNRVRKGAMPPDEDADGRPVKRRPNTEEVAALRRWIEAGAPEAEPAAARPFLADADVAALAAADLRRAAARERPDVRYFTLAHLANAGLSEDELDTYRLALSKLVNSLSWGPAVVPPRAVDPARTVYRVELSRYRWGADAWERVAAAYPYAARLDGDDGKFLTDATRTKAPLIRADWFVHAAAQPPLYHDLLEVPKTAKGLEAQLGVDVAGGVAGRKAARAGFNGSGVSQNNRLIERHPSRHGAYWKSYDFAGSVGAQNLFSSPVGVKDDLGFRHDGGEVIFSLTNGLQGYMLVDGKGERIDRGPVGIVSDPRRPDRTVVNGLSCMGCHVRGVIAKADQVREHVEANRRTFPAATVEAVKALYPPKAAFDKLLKEDEERFLAALDKTGVRPGRTEPVAALAAAFEAELGQGRAAAELGLRPAELRARLARSEGLARLLGPLKVEGGTVKRQVFEAAFLDARRLAVPGPSVSGERVLGGHTGAVRSVAFSPDGRRLASSSHLRETAKAARGEVKVWDAASGRELLSFRDEGGSAPPHVLFAPDGRRLAGADRSAGGAVTLWDAATGKAERVFKGAGSGAHFFDPNFSPDGRRLTGASGGAVYLWDADSGKAALSWTAPEAVRAALFSPDGRRVATVPYGAKGPVRVWDAATGKELLQLAPSSRVYHLAWAPDGASLALAGTAYVGLWDAATGKERHAFRPVTNVTSVAFSPDGKRLAAGSVGGVARVWSSATGQELHHVEPGDAVCDIAFSPDGRTLALAVADGTVRLVPLPR